MRQVKFFLVNGFLDPIVQLQFCVLSPIRILLYKVALSNVSLASSRTTWTAFGLITWTFVKVKKNRPTCIKIGQISNLILMLSKHFQYMRTTRG